jgi:L-idonate 5-dehydrogenase
MTDTALAATLYGAEDLRMVERPLGTLEPGMVRIRFGAGGICGSDMHYFRHARTGDFVVTSPLVLGHEVAGEIVEGSSWVSGCWIWCQATSAPTKAPRRAFPLLRVLWTN